VNTSKRLCK